MCLSGFGHQGFPLALFLKLHQIGPWHWSGREFPYKIHPPPGHNFSNHYCLHFMQAGIAWNYIFFHNPTPAAHCFHVHLHFNHHVKFFLSVMYRNLQLFWFHLLSVYKVINFIHIGLFINVLYLVLIHFFPVSKNMFLSCTQFFLHKTTFRIKVN